MLSVKISNSQQIAYEFVIKAILLQLKIVELDDLFKNTLNW